MALMSKNLLHQMMLPIKTKCFSVSSTSVLQSLQNLFVCGIFLCLPFSISRVWSEHLNFASTFLFAKIFSIHLLFLDKNPVLFVQVYKVVFSSILRMLSLWNICLLF